MLELSEFYTHSRMADGHLNFCKACVKVRIAIHRENNMEQVRERDRLRSQDPSRKEKVRIYQAGTASRYPERKQARSLLRSALKSGTVIQYPCFICGDANSEAHHTHYDSPLSVTWLCKLHHEEVHKNV